MQNAIHNTRGRTLNNALCYHMYVCFLKWLLFSPTYQLSQKYAGKNMFKKIKGSPFFLPEVHNGKRRTTAQEMGRTN